jgi:hypothetical protein
VKNTTTSSNPRTQAQQAQRAKLANVVTTYQLLSSFIREAYPRRPKNLSAYNLFIKENLSRTEVYLSKEEVAGKACVVAPYGISKGSLCPIEAVAQGDVLTTSLRVPRSFELTADTTTEEVSAALLAANPDLRRDDRITILHLIQDISLSGVPHITMKRYEFTLDLDSYAASSVKFYQRIPPLRAEELPTY